MKKGLIIKFVAFLLACTAAIAIGTLIPTKAEAATHNLSPPNWACYPSSSCANSEAYIENYTTLQLLDFYNCPGLFCGLTAGDTYIVETEFTDIVDCRDVQYTVTFVVQSVTQSGVSFSSIDTDRHCTTPIPGCFRE